MTEETTGPIDVRNLSPEKKHQLYIEHSPAALAELGRVFAGARPAPVLLLSGEPGCGRTGLLEAAARDAGFQGNRVAVLPLDLGGYEEGLDLTRFAEVQIARRWELQPTEREALRERALPLLPFIPSSLAGAALVSLLLRQENPAEAWKTLPAAAPDARPALAGLLRDLSRGSCVVVHAVEGAQLNDPLRRWLVDETRRNSALILALSCAPADADDHVAPRAERLRLELSPLPAEGLLQPTQELLEDVDLEIADRLQRFLDLAALCGENVPAETLFHHLELEEDEREELLDLIDEELVENEELRLFVDHQYGHPSFPGLLTYAFLSPRINHAFLEPIPSAKRQQLARELLDFLNRSFPIQTRGMTLLRLNLAGSLGDEPAARQAFLHELRVWIGVDEIEGLATELAAAVAEGITTAPQLLGTARQADGHWPSHTRLAFLEAAQSRPAGLSPADFVELHNLRAELLRDLGRQAEALEDATRSLEKARVVHGAGHPAVARALNLQGILLRDLQRPQEALVPLEQALEMQDPQKADANLASILANLGMVLRDLGQREAAQQHLEHALAIHREAFGESHPTVAADLNNLATLAREMNQPEKALEHLGPIVDIARRLYGDVHPETSRAITNVAGVLRDLGDGEAARTHLEAALQIDRQAFGEVHPQIVADLNNLAVIERELGNTDEAREHFEEALALSLQAFGEDHPLTIQLRRATAEG